MNDVVERDLAEQNRTVTTERLRQTFEEWATIHGRTPTKSELKKLLDWRGKKNLGFLYPAKRAEATALELEHFVERATLEFKQRRGSVQTRGPYAFALVVLLYCALLDAPLHEALKMSRAELGVQLRTLAWACTPMVATLCGATIRELEHAGGLASRGDDDEERAARRFVQTVRATLMDDLAPDLRRDSRAFFQVARLQSSVTE